MDYRFAALRFAEDKNICDRVYWYLTDFSVKEGQRVIAPVGTHDRLQVAVVERMLNATAKNAPYDINLAKKIVAPLGARRIPLNETKNCFDLGGLRYDAKHFTRYRVFVRSDRLPLEADALRLRQYGVKRFIRLDDADDADDALSHIESEQLQRTLLELARAEGCTLFYGGRETLCIVSALLFLLAGVGEEAVKADCANDLTRFLYEIKHRGGAEHFLYDVAFPKKEVTRLREKLQ